MIPIGYMHEVIQDIAKKENIDLSGTTLFYYETYEYEFDKDAKEWSVFAPEPSFVTDVQIPKDKHLEGFDVATFTSGTDPECSPLSCNSLVETIPVNHHDILRHSSHDLSRGRNAGNAERFWSFVAIYAVC